MKKLFYAASLAALLAGCASIPQPKPQAAPVVRQVAKTASKPVEAAPVEATTPNEIVKKRWYDRFLRHKTK